MSAPLEMFTIKVQARSWKCSCGDRGRAANERASLRSADGHAWWHCERGEATALDVGALTPTQAGVA